MPWPTCIPNTTMFSNTFTQNPKSGDQYISRKKSKLFSKCSQTHAIIQ